MFCIYHPVSCKKALHCGIEYCVHSGSMCVYKTHITCFEHTQRERVFLSLSSVTCVFLSGHTIDLSLMLRLCQPFVCICGNILKVYDKLWSSLNDWHDRHIINVMICVCVIGLLFLANRDLQDKVSDLYFSYTLHRLRKSDLETSMMPLSGSYEMRGTNITQNILLTIEKCTLV